jgi:hypothetical protein
MPMRRIIEEMAAYLNGQVHLLSAFLQDSTATFGSFVGNVPVLSRARPALKPAGETIPSLRISPRLDPGDLPPEHAFALAGDDQPADFRWDRTSGRLYRRSGDRVAEDLQSLADVAATLEKWQAVGALFPLAAERSIRLKLAPNGFGWLHEPGARIALRLERPPGWREGTRYAAVFNIASDGTVQLIYPLAGEDGRLDVRHRSSRCRDDGPLSGEPPRRIARSRSDTGCRAGDPAPAVRTAAGRRRGRARHLRTLYRRVAARRRCRCRCRSRPQSRRDQAVSWPAPFTSVVWVRPVTSMNFSRYFGCSVPIHLSHQVK